MIHINNIHEIEHIRVNKGNFSYSQLRKDYKLKNGILFRDYGPLENAPNNL